MIKLGILFGLDSESLQQVKPGSNAVIGAEKFDGFVGCNTFRQPGTLQLNADQVSQFRRIATGVNAADF